MEYEFWYIVRIALRIVKYTFVTINLHENNVLILSNKIWNVCDYHVWFMKIYSRLIDHSEFIPKKNQIKSEENFNHTISIEIQDCVIIIFDIILKNKNHILWSLYG